MEDFKGINLEFVENPFFEDGLTLNDLILKLNQNFNELNNNFANRCYIIQNLYSLMVGKTLQTKDKQFLDFYNLMQKFGFDKGIVSKYRNSYFKFCKSFDIETQSVDNFCELKDIYKSFSPSKLFELLPLSDTQIEKDISIKKLTADMTVKEIREYVKSFKNGEPGADKVLEEADNEIAEEFISINDTGKTQYLFKIDNEVFEELRSFVKEKNKEEHTGLDMFHIAATEGIKLYLEKYKK